MKCKDIKQGVRYNYRHPVYGRIIVSVVSKSFVRFRYAKKTHTEFDVLLLSGQKHITNGAGRFLSEAE